MAYDTAALATALKRWEAAERTSVLAISMLANVQKRPQAAERAQMPANIVPNEMQCRHSGDGAIERIWMEFALCAAPLDAILAEIACKATTFETAPSPHRPMSCVDAVQSTMGGAHNRLCPLLSCLLLSRLRLYHGLT